MAKNVKQESTVPDTPNRIEFNRIRVEITKCLVSGANLTRNFWVKGVSDDESCDEESDLS